jgi:type I restriction-modification system DNA methylase subunit
MNPPFTKKQFINTDFRATLSQSFSDYKEYINNEQSYWSYFVLLADRFVKPGGRVALVLPASILRQPTFGGLRRLLLERYSIFGERVVSGSLVSGRKARGL